MTEPAQTHVFTPHHLPTSCPHERFASHGERRAGAQAHAVLNGMGGKKRSQDLPFAKRTAELVLNTNTFHSIAPSSFSGELA